MKAKLSVLSLASMVVSMSASAQSVAGDLNSLPDAVQLRGGKNPLVKVDDTKRIKEDKTKPPMPKGRTVANRIAATVNGNPITSSEITMRLAPVLKQLVAIYPRRGQEFVRQLAISKRQIMDELIERELIRSEFQQLGGYIRDSIIDQEMNRTIKNIYNGDRKAFLESLRVSGMTVRAYRESVRKNLEVQAMRAQKYDAEIPPTPDELRREYELSKHEFRDMTKDKVKFRKIFIPLERGDTKETMEVKLSLAELIIEELKKDPSQFAEFAQRYSQDMYADKGGQWPEIERGSLSAEAGTIIFNGKKDEIVGPILDNMGFTIVHVQQVKFAPAPPLSEIKEQIDRRARDKRSFERARQWISRLKKKAIIKTYI